MPTIFCSSYDYPAFATSQNKILAHSLKTNGFLNQIGRFVFRPDLVVRKHPLISLGLLGLSAYGLVTYNIFKHYSGLSKINNGKNMSDTSSCKTLFKSFYAMTIKNKIKVLLSPFIFISSFVYPEPWNDFAHTLDILSRSQETRKEEKIEKKIEEKKIEEKKIEEKKEPEQKKPEEEKQKEKIEEEKKKTEKIEEKKEQKIDEKKKIEEEKKIEKPFEITYENIEALIEKYDTDTLKTLAQSNKEKLLTLFTKPSEGEKQPLLQTALETICCFNHDYTPIDKKYYNYIRFFDITKHGDRKINQTKLLDFITQTLSLDLQNIDWYVPISSKPIKMNAINFALKEQYEPLVDYLLEKYPTILYDKDDKSKLQLDLGYITERGSMYPPNTVPYSIKENDIINTKIDVFDQKNKRIPAIGHYPCFVKVIKRLKEDNIDLTESYLPIFESSHCYFIPRFLVALGQIDDKNFESVSTIAIAESLLKIYDYTKRLGDLITVINLSTNALFYEDIIAGLQKLNQYVKKHNIYEDLQKEIIEKLELLKKESQLESIDISKTYPSNRLKDQGIFNQLSNLLKNAKPEHVYNYFFGDKDIKKLDLTKTFEYKDRREWLYSILTQTPAVESYVTFYDQTGELTSYKCAFNQQKESSRNYHLEYQYIADMLITKIRDSIDLMKDKDTGNYGILEIIFKTSKPSTLETYLTKSGFLENRYNKKDKSLNLNLTYIYRKFDANYMYTFVEDKFYEKTPFHNFLIYSEFAQRTGFLPGFIKLLKQIQKADPSIKNLSAIKIKYKQTIIPVILALLKTESGSNDNNKDKAIFETILQIFIESTGNLGSVDEITCNKENKKSIYEDINEGLIYFEAYIKEAYTTYPEPKEPLDLNKSSLKLEIQKTSSNIDGLKKLYEEEANMPQKLKNLNLKNLTADQVRNPSISGNKDFIALINKLEKINKNFDPNFDWHSIQNNEDAHLKDCQEEINKLVYPLLEKDENYLRELNERDKKNRENWELRKKQLNDLNIKEKLKEIFKKLNEKLTKKKIDEKIFEKKTESKEKKIFEKIGKK